MGIKLQEQFSAFLESTIVKFYQRIQKTKYTTYITLDKSKIDSLCNKFEEYTKLLKDVIAPNNPCGTNILDRYKLSSAATRAIMSVSAFQLDEDGLRKSLKPDEKIPICILQPNEAFAYVFCKQVISRFNVETKTKYTEFGLNDTYEFLYPAQVIHFNDDGDYELVPFERLFFEYLSYYKMRVKHDPIEQRHLPMIAFACFLNMIDLSSDSIHSPDLIKIYYGS